MLPVPIRLSAGYASTALETSSAAPVRSRRFFVSDLGAPAHDCAATGSVTTAA